MIDTPELSKADSRVLAQIFDPESSPSSRVEIVDSLPKDTHIRDAVLLSSLEAEQRKAIKRIEDMSQQGNTTDDKEKDAAFNEAYQILSSLIKEQPTYAAPFNNRAQLIRWRHGDNILTNSPDTVQNAISNKPSIMEIALDDLNMAIRLATPASLSSPVSRAQAMLLAQAHTQRATLLHVSSKELKKSLAASKSTDEFSIPPSLKPFGFTPETLEAAGAKDFFLGGRYGNEISKAMAVHTNPYAKMCGNIVKEAIRKEMGQDNKATITDFVGS